MSPVQKVFDNTDLGNDVIKKGAFKKSVRKRGLKGIKLLYQHKTDMPIGVFDSIKEDDQRQIDRASDQSKYKCS